MEGFRTKGDTSFVGLEKNTLSVSSLEFNARVLFFPFNIALL